MNLFAFSDLHLPFGADKPMDIFGGWQNYTERIEKNWKKIVLPADTVVLCGDLSWAVDLKSSAADFGFLHRLPGKKIIVKGNHDFWWSTAKKIREFFSANGFDDMHLLHNNYYQLANIAVCGTRGWIYDGAEKDKRIILREAGRLEASLSAAVKDGFEPIVFLHYPPAYGDFVCTEIMEVLKKYGVKKLYYGHIHGSGFKKTISSCQGISMNIASCDCVGFTPVLVTEVGNTK